MALSILQDFLGTVCSVCGREKRSRMSHCGRCYHALPRPMQSALWKQFGKGYEEAFTASVEWLRARRPPTLFDSGK
jgi:hypothetical protein